RSGHRGAGPAAPPRAQSRAWRGAGRRHAQRPAGRSDGADAPSPGRSAAPRGVGGCGAGGRGRRVMSHTAARGLLGLLLLLNAPSTPLLAAARAATAESAPTVASVGIQGNLRVEEDAIRVHLRSQAGQPYDAETVDSDIRAIYGMGFFDQVRADVTPEPDHKVAVVFHVQERPLVRSVKVEGTKKVKREEVEGALKVRPHTILDPEKAAQGIEAAKKLYSEKGYLDAEITYKTEPVGENEVDILYTVDEKEPVHVVDVDFEGNEAFSDRK